MHQVAAISCQHDAGPEPRGGKCVRAANFHPYVWACWACAVASDKESKAAVLGGRNVGVDHTQLQQVVQADEVLRDLPSLEQVPDG